MGQAVDLENRIAPDAQLGQGVVLWPGMVVEAGVSIGTGVCFERGDPSAPCMIRIGAHATIGENATMPVSAWPRAAWSGRVQ